MEKDFRHIPLSEKKALVEEYNQIVLHYHEKIQSSTARYGDSFKTVWFANSEGTYLMEEKPNLFFYLEAIARDEDIVQHSYQTIGGAEGYQRIEGFHEKATKAAAKAIELLSARPVKGGKYTVITNPVMSGVFTHEAFGHLSEADFVYENPQMKELMVLGKRFGVEDLNILDDGS
jgi:TldD protein